MLEMQARLQLITNATHLNSKHNCLYNWNLSNNIKTTQSKQSSHQKFPEIFEFAFFCYFVCIITCQVTSHICTCSSHHVTRCHYWHNKYFFRTCKNYSSFISFPTLSTAEYLLLRHIDQTTNILPWFALY